MKVPHYFDKSEDLSPHHAKIIYGEYHTAVLWVDGVESICSSVEYTYVAGRARVRHAARREPDGERHYLVRKVDFE